MSLTAWVWTVIVLWILLDVLLVALVHGACRGCEDEAPLSSYTSDWARQEMEQYSVPVERPERGQPTVRRVQ